MSNQSVAERYQALRHQYAEFDSELPLEKTHDFVHAGVIWGEVQGNETPRILLIALEPGHWKYSQEAKLDELAYELLASLEGDWPVFAHLKDDTNSRCYALFGLDGTDGTHSVDEVPDIELIREYERLNKYTTLKWSMQIYTRLMHQLDAFHEQVYQTVKDRVSDKNDIIEEVAKILFLESFRCHQDNGLTFEYEGKQLNFQEVFDYRYVRQHGALAVRQIQAAFDQLKFHEDYVVVTDDGTRNAIFDDKTHLRLTQPKNYETLLEAIQNLGPVTTNEGRRIKDQGKLSDVQADLLGRVFDVFLRANFESKGGLGVYLTPNPVKQVVESYNPYYDHVKMTWVDTGDLELDEDGNPIWAGYRTDLRNVSTGKTPKYELFPTTSGLAMGSKPDNKGNWKQVKGGSIDPAVLFIDRCLQLLKPGGRLMIVLPDGVLFNSGERYVREYIMGKKDEQSGEFVGGKAIVKAVISLPADTFKLSGTGAKTSILYLQKRQARDDNPEQFLPEPQTDVFMAVAETLGYLVKNNIEDYSAGVSNDLDLMPNGFTALMQKPDIPTYLVGNSSEIENFYELIPAPNEAYTQLFWPYKTSHLDEYIYKKKEEEKRKRQLAKQAGKNPR